MNRDDNPNPYREHDGRDSGDALYKRYHEASALDPTQPSPALREAVLAQARAAAAGFARDRADPVARREEIPELIAEYDHPTLGNGKNSFKSAELTPFGGGSAANDRSWRIRAVASVAVLGLATLLILQFERGTPEEREIAMGPGPATAPANGSTRSAVTAPTAQEPAMEQASAPRNRATAQSPAPVPALRPYESQTPDAPDHPKAALADKARAEQGPSGMASALGNPPLPAPQPVERGTSSGGASGRDSVLADRATVPEMAGPGLAAGAMKAAPPAPAKATESSLAPSPVPPPPAAAPAAALAVRPSAQNLEARSRAMSDATAPAGRGTESASPGLNSTASLASQRLLVAAGTGTLEAARQALHDGAQVNARDAAGQTPLMLAARRGDEAMLRLLLAAGADRTLIDAAGLTSAEHARRAGQANLLPWLNPAESAPSDPSPAQR